MLAITTQAAHSSEQLALSRIYLLLFPVPVVLFVGALCTDAVHAATGDPGWLHFSEWLIAAGFGLGTLAAMVLLIEFITNAALRRAGRGWAHLLMFMGAMAVALANSMVHGSSGRTGDVVPYGLVLSAVGAALALGAAATLFRARARPLHGGFDGGADAAELAGRREGEAGTTRAGGNRRPGTPGAAHRVR